MDHYQRKNFAKSRTTPELATSQTAYAWELNSQIICLLTGIPILLPVQRGPDLTRIIINQAGIPARGCNNNLQVNKSALNARLRQSCELLSVPACARFF